MNVQKHYQFLETAPRELEGERPTQRRISAYLLGIATIGAMPLLVPALLIVALALRLAIGLFWALSRRKGGKVRTMVVLGSGAHASPPGSTSSSALEQPRH